MNRELELAWLQLAGWSAALADNARRVHDGRGNEDPKDTVPPRQKIDRLIRDIGAIRDQINEMEANPAGPWSWTKAA